MFRVFATAIVTAILTSAFWLFYFNIAYAPSGTGTVQSSVDVAVVDPASGPPVVAPRRWPWRSSPGRPRQAPARG